MLTTLLNLLPKLPAVIASLPEFAALVHSAKATLSEQDQTKLQSAYELAKDGSDAAHDELAALVASLPAGMGVVWACATPKKRADQVSLTGPIVGEDA